MTRPLLRGPHRGRGGRGRRVRPTAGDPWLVDVDPTGKVGRRQDVRADGGRAAGDGVAGEWWWVAGPEGAQRSVSGDDPRWSVLVYRVPTGPSRYRATVWRRVKTLGAVYLQNSVVALPWTVGHERSFRSLRAEIVAMGGTADDALAVVHRPAH